MQTLKITLLSSLLSQTLSTKYYRAAVANDFIDRETAANYCNFAHDGLATILSITDNHDARTICDHGDGCWIGVKGYDCNDGGCANYQWDDGSALTRYGFGSGGEASNGWIQNVYVHTDGPWDILGDFDKPVSCVYIMGGIAANNGQENEKWYLDECDDGATTRGTLCNIETPEVEVLFYSMQDDTGVNDWERSHPSALYQQPLVTNKERCRYANDPTDVATVTGGEATIILQGCWAITNPGVAAPTDNDIVHLARFQSLVGYEDCVLQFNIDPWASAGGVDACQVSFSINSGTDWTPLAAFGSPIQKTIFIDLDDGPTAGLINGQANFGFRFSLDPTIVAVADKEEVECYFNNVHLWCDTV